MKKLALISFIPFLVISICFTGCKDDKTEHYIKFATTADYPPFEYNENGQIKGFDIELARLIAQELQKEAVFENMEFSNIFAALQSGFIDAAISTITITTERQKNFDFSNSYYIESLAMIYPENMPITIQSQIAHKKIACQLGTTMEIWLKNNATDAEISTMNSNNQAIEALKAGHVDGVLIDSVQATSFTRNNLGLAYTVIAKSETGYSIAVPKGSPLKEKINAALKTLEKNGSLAQLQKKWLENPK